MSDPIQGQPPDNRQRSLQFLREARDLVGADTLARMSVIAAFQDQEPVDIVDVRQAEMLLVSSGISLDRMSAVFELPKELVGELAVRSARLQKKNLADWILESIEEAKEIGWFIMAGEEPDDNDFVEPIAEPDLLKLVGLLMRDVLDRPLTVVETERQNAQDALDAADIDNTKLAALWQIPPERVTEALARYSKIEGTPVEDYVGEIVSHLRFLEQPVFKEDASTSSGDDQPAIP